MLKTPLGSGGIRRRVGSCTASLPHAPGVTFCDQMCSEADSHGPTDLPTQEPSIYGWVHVGVCQNASIRWSSGSLAAKLAFMVAGSW